MDKLNGTLTTLQHNVLANTTCRFLGSDTILTTISEQIGSVAPNISTPISLSGRPQNKPKSVDWQHLQRLVSVLPHFHLLSTRPPLFPTYSPTKPGLPIQGSAVTAAVTEYFGPSWHICHRQ